MKTLDVSLVSTEEGSEQGNVQVVVTIPAKEFPYLQVIKTLKHYNYALLVCTRPLYFVPQEKYPSTHVTLCMIDCIQDFVDANLVCGKVKM